jgi:feruloyl-CoA synthase
MTYGQLYEGVCRIAQSLLDRGLSAERPVAVLSGNDLEHLLLMLAGQHVGIPTSHISPSYSLISKDYSKLVYAVELLSPGLVFVSDGYKFRYAIHAVVDENTELVVTQNPPPGVKATDFAELLQTTPTRQVDAAHERIEPDDIAKILFTSGSTGLPKAAINTHRMLCSNQQMIRQTFSFVADEPPVLLDWLPWNHTFGGNHNLGIALYNGGTLYIDDGKPGPALIGETIRNLREISTSFYLNVPKGYADILPFLQADTELRKGFFERLHLLFYAGANLSQPIWDAYRALALETVGERILMVTCLGATETAPMATQLSWDTDRSGNIGIPVPGVEAKLIARGEKYEMRLRGPSITPGYFRQPHFTEKAFDEEGFYCLGDAIRFVDPSDVNQGFFFDGRFSEDFKLASGTWVSAGPLRAAILNHFLPFVRDVVITGHNRDELGMIIFPNIDACRTLCGDLASNGNVAEAVIVGQPAVVKHFRNLLEIFAKNATGTSNRITRAIIAKEPPSLDLGEVTDKGNLNQGKILERRTALVEELYAVKATSNSLLIRV